MQSKKSTGEGKKKCSIVEREIGREKILQNGKSQDKKRGQTKSNKAKKGGQGVTVSPQDWGSRG